MIHIANEWGVNASFFETSAKEKINDKECFFEAVRYLRRNYAQDWWFEYPIKTKPTDRYCVIL